MIEDKYKIVDKFGHCCLFLALLDHFDLFLVPQGSFYCYGLCLASIGLSGLFLIGGITDIRYLWISIVTMGAKSVS